MVIKSSDIPFSPSEHIELPPPYSYVIFISDEIKKSAGNRHDALLFSCIKSLEKHSSLLHTKEAFLEILNIGDVRKYANKTLIIDDYLLFLRNPDFLLTDNLYFYSQVANLFNTDFVVRFDHSYSLRFKHNEKFYKKYEEIAGIEIANKIFFKTEKIRFNYLAIGDIFVYEEKIYEKVPMIKEGCCAPTFNSINVDNKNNLIYLNNNAGVEKIL